MSSTFTQSARTAQNGEPSIDWRVVFSLEFIWSSLRKTAKRWTFPTQQGNTPPLAKVREKWGTQQ